MTPDEIANLKQLLIDGATLVNPLDVACPNHACRADTGEECRTSSSGNGVPPHSTRRDRARLQGQLKAFEAVYSAKPAIEIVALPPPEKKPSMGDLEIRSDGDYIFTGTGWVKLEPAMPPPDDEPLPPPPPPSRCMAVYTGPPGATVAPWVADEQPLVYIPREAFDQVFASILKDMRRDPDLMRDYPMTIEQRITSLVRRLRRER